MTVYYNTLICIRIRLYFVNMKYFVLNTSSNNDTKLRKPVTHLASAVVRQALQQYGMTDR